MNTDQSPHAASATPDSSTALRELEIRKLVRRQAAWWREWMVLLMIAAGLALMRWLLLWTGAWPAHGNGEGGGRATTAWAGFVMLDGLWWFFGLGIWALVLLVRGIGLVWLDGWIGGASWEERKVREIVEREQAARARSRP